jgi:hypothetical protein
MKDVKRTISEVRRGLDLHLNVSETLELLSMFLDEVDQSILRCTSEGDELSTDPVKRVGQGCCREIEEGLSIVSDPVGDGFEFEHS